MVAQRVQRNGPLPATRQADTPSTPMSRLSGTQLANLPTAQLSLLRRGGIMAIALAPVCRRAFVLAVLIGLAVHSAHAQDEKDAAATREYAVAAGLQSKELYAQAARRWQQ